MQIENYGYKPKFKRRKMKKDVSLYLGPEIEVEKKINPYTHSTVLSKIKNKWKKSFYCTSDCTLRGGVEIKFQPFTLNYAKKKMEFKKLFEELNKYYKTSIRCGLHVHLDKSFFNKKDLIKLKLFFQKLEYPLFKFSERTSNKYCEADNSNLRKFLHMSYSTTTYRASLHISHKSDRQKTIEIRLFAGTINYNRYRSILEFCYAVSYYVKNRGINYFIYNLKWKDFTNWVNKEKTYSYLIKDLKNKKMIT